MLEVGWPSVGLGFPASGVLEEAGLICSHCGLRVPSVAGRDPAPTASPSYHLGVQRSCLLRQASHSLAHLQGREGRRKELRCLGGCKGAPPKGLQEQGSGSLVASPWSLPPLLLVSFQLEEGEFRV